MPGEFPLRLFPTMRRIKRAPNLIRVYLSFSLSLFIPFSRFGLNSMKFQRMVLATMTRWNEIDRLEYRGSHIGSKLKVAVAVVLEEREKEREKGVSVCIV